MRHRLKRWWHLRGLWAICFAILFDKDVAHIDSEKAFDEIGFLELFGPVSDLKVIYPEVFPVITGMMQSGLKSVLSNLSSEDGGVVDSRQTHGTPKISSSNSGLFTSRFAIFEGFS